jgi:glutathione S-transferase
LPELYDHILSDGCYTVRLALSLLHIEATRKTVDYVPSRTPRSTAALAVTPAGDIPVFIDGGLVLTDITAILHHLAAGHPEWRAGDPAVERWVDFAAGPLAALSAARLVSLFAAPGDREALVAEGRAALRSLDDHLTDQHLAGHQWLAGDTPSLAEIAVFPRAMLSHDCGVGHEDYPALNLWQRRVRKLSRFISMPGIPDYF